MSDDQTAPVPTTEVSNGEVTMDPSAKNPAGDAEEHAEVLEESARKPSEVHQSDDPQPGFDNTPPART